MVGRNHARAVRPQQPREHPKSGPWFEMTGSQEGGRCATYEPEQPGLGRFDKNIHLVARYLHLEWVEMDA